MFILDITYVAPVERIDELMDDHVAWLRQGKAAGSFLAWGRKLPRTGGIVLAVGGRAEVEAVAAADPFVSSGAASVQVIEMAPSFVAEGLEMLAQ